MNFSLINYPLERFLIWLTGNDRQRNVTIDETIAEAIRTADPNETLAHVEKLPSGCIVLHWAEAWQSKRLDGMTQIELLDLMTSALQQGDLMTVKTIQNKLAMV